MSREGDDNTNKETDANRQRSAWEGDTYSLSSSVTDFMYENGRRYHGYHEGKYWSPNDEAQNEVLDLTHGILMMRMERLYSSPLVDPKNILDVGTGTGIWAVAMADRFPQAEVIGTDLSPIQPEWIPENLHFEIDDAENTWLYKERQFDFIHIRMLLGSIRDWPRLIKQAYKHLKPGGWIEIVELELPYRCDDGTATEDSAIMQCCNLAIEAAAKLGRHMDVYKHQRRWVEEAGFQNIQASSTNVPIGPWALDAQLKEIGICNQKMILQGLEGFTMALFTRAHKWTHDEVQVFLANVRHELQDPNIHCYFNMHVVCGQKPLSEDAPSEASSSATSTRPKGVQDLLNTD